MSIKTITFRTAAQAAIFEHEITGQISDGHWENSRGTCWEVWSSAEVAVGPNVGRNFWVKRDTFNLNAKALLDVVSERMRLYAVLARAGYTGEQIEDLERAFDALSDGCPFRGAPTYEGQYYDGVRARLAEYDLALVERQVKNGLEVYTRKHLVADLKEMKATMKTTATREG